MINKITLNDLKMAEHLLEENCVKIVEILFFLRYINGNINGNSRAGLVKISVKSKSIASDRFPYLKTFFLKYQYQEMKKNLKIHYT
jgi:hypothetical protein